MNEIKANLRQLIDTMFHNVPSGVGSEGKIRLTMDQLDDVLENGAEWAVRNGYGWHEDLKHLEENGRIDGADSMVVSHRAKTRGLPQLGSLGAGNHFLEIQRVDEIFDSHVAKVFGITAKDQIVVMIHTGSRGCGYQICEDSIRELEKPYHKEGKEFVSDKFKIRLPDRQLVCAPLNSREAERYIKAMKCAANYAWANRQMITHWVREAFERVLRKSAEELDLAVVYDVAHNIAKLEEHVIEGKRRKVYVHRKGATRAFPGNLSQVPEKYQAVGQPVLIPGDMGTASYILVGTELAMVESWGSTCHGSGRVLSRHEAIRRFRDRGIKEELLAQGIYVRAASAKVLSEEAPAAYKDVDAVVEACHGAGISRKIARMKPLGVVKG
jgi:tRNA-splicing ligase RtcB